MRSQTRKPDVWVVVDNSTSLDPSWVGCPDVVYEHVEEPQTIGWMRNRCLEIAIQLGAEYIVFWDDDDYYPPMRIERSIQALDVHPDADIAGSTKMYLLVLPENVLMTTGPYHDKHATGATMVVRRRYALYHRFDDTHEKGEEKFFTEGWNANMVQLVPEETIVAIGHGRNTVDKSDVVRNPKKYSATVVNEVNGKQVFRMRWPVQWDLFRKTFFASESPTPPECNRSEGGV